jgi:nitrite reductase/ring-hydroxylating ferredoxin subunit
MKLAIEKAIAEAAPEMTRIEVEGADQSVSTTSFGNGATTKSSFPPAQSPQMVSGEWLTLAELPEFAAGDLVATELGGMKVLVCRVGETLYAYQDSCPSCGAALRGGALQENILTCSACGRRYDVCRAGQSMDMSELYMAPLPLLVEKDGIKIAVATEG